MPSLGVRSPWFRRLTDGRERSSKKRFLAHSYFASRAAGLHLHDFGCGISILGIQKLGRLFAKVREGDLGPAIITRESYLEKSSQILTKKRSSKKQFLAHSSFASRTAGLHLHDFGCGRSLLGI